ncbi:tetraacyldisaccharide 4'-kinase [Candidatus Curculioniphilus buchneri]|uniref:tetraacyldisaccharide 4'-kinase n=1 Tax=Candidatus Curculioniphilus buchneri TaxID=690594 RepID=UPI00376ED956
MKTQRIWSNTSPFYFLIPFSWLYGLITTLIRFSYHYGWKKTHHFPFPIVVVGNLTVGGNGKTPLVLWLVKILQQRGWRVGVVSRGYGGYSSYYPLLLNACINSDQCGDEPLLIWRRTGVPVAVSPRRTEAVAALFKKHTLDIVISDDGLQHYALARDIELVVIDGDHRFGNGWRLPAGPMRECANRLKTVHGIIVNGGNAKPGELQMRLQAGIPINLYSGERLALTNLTPVVVMAGIGHPSRFFATVRAGGVTPIREVSFSDHQNYKQKMLDELTPRQEFLLMTEKDAVKCGSFARAHWWYLPVDAFLPTCAEKKLLILIEKAIICAKSENVSMMKDV